MALFKKKKESDPHWLEIIKEDIKAAQCAGKKFCHGYAPVGQEKLLMTLPKNITFRLLMKVENDQGAEYYYQFNF